MPLRAGAGDTTIYIKHGPCHHIVYRLGGNFKQLKRPLQYRIVNAGTGINEGGMGALRRGTRPSPGG